MSAVLHTSKVRAVHFKAAARKCRQVQCYEVKSETHSLFLIMLVQDGAAQDAARSSSPGEDEDF